MSESTTNSGFWVEFFSYLDRIGPALSIPILAIAGLSWFVGWRLPIGLQWSFRRWSEYQKERREAEAKIAQDLNEQHALAHAKFEENLKAIAFATLEARCPLKDPSYEEAIKLKQLLVAHD